MTVTTEPRLFRDLSLDLPAISASVQYGVDVPGVDEYIYDTVDKSRTNIGLEQRQVRIADARHDLARFSLGDNGFELRKHASDSAGIAAGEGAVGDAAAGLKARYHEEMLPLIAEVSGTPHIIAQNNGFLIRHGKRSAIKTAARPASFAHCDYTPRSADMMRDLIAGEVGERLPPFRHFAIYQTWRAVSPPPQDSLLTFCDGRSVDDDDCIIIKNVNGPEDVPGNVFYNKLGRARAHHCWFFFSGLQQDEVIVFMAHDSRRDHQLNVLHTSFLNPLAGEDAVPRASVEARFFAFFE